MGGGSLPPKICRTGKGKVFEILPELIHLNGLIRLFYFAN